MSPLVCAAINAFIETKVHMEKTRYRWKKKFIRQGFVTEQNQDMFTNLELQQINYNIKYEICCREFSVSSFLA